MNSRLFQHRHWRVLFALLAICANLLLSTVAFFPGHIHAQARPCEVCQAAHLPFESVPVASLDQQLSPVTWHRAPLVLGSPCDRLQHNFDPRGPPIDL